jgi:hypothetical protein
LSKRGLVRPVLAAGLVALTLTALPAGAAFNLKQARTRLRTGAGVVTDGSFTPCQGTGPYLTPLAFAFTGRIPTRGPSHNWKPGSYQVTGTADGWYFCPNGISDYEAMTLSSVDAQGNWFYSTCTLYASVVHPEVAGVPPMFRFQGTCDATTDVPGKVYPWYLDVVVQALGSTLNADGSTTYTPLVGAYVAAA